MNDAEGIRNLVGTGLVQLVRRPRHGGDRARRALLAQLAADVDHAARPARSSAAVMAFAFKRLRPIFRERSVITAEVTGRLGAGAGRHSRGEDLRRRAARAARVRARRAPAVPQRRRDASPASSAVTAFTTLIIGIVGVLMIIVGGRAILAGTMTLGDFFMYVLFIGLLAAPLVQIASIGTQISEAFAGLDRIREIRMMATEDEHDAVHSRRRRRRRRRAIRGRRLRVQGRHVPVLRDVSFHAPAGIDHGARGIQRLGEEHADQSHHGVQPPAAGPISIDGTRPGDAQAQATIARTWAW